MLVLSIHTLVFFLFAESQKSDALSLSKFEWRKKMIQIYVILWVVSLEFVNVTGGMFWRDHSNWNFR